MIVISFFAGCGGLDLGFEQADFDVVWANEFEPHCRATYLRNHPDTEFVQGDICKIDPNAIPDCDVFIGGSLRGIAKLHYTAKGHCCQSCQTCQTENEKSVRALI